MNSFDYPKHGYGFHSGWNNESLEAVFSKRREVTLNKMPHKKITCFNNDLEVPPLLLKQDFGQRTIVGLSSGMGSALVPFQGKVIKYKRCGSQYREIIRKTWYNLKIRSNNCSLFSKVESEKYIGVLPFAYAQRELNFTKFLKENNLPVLQDPIALYKFRLFSEDDMYYTLLFSVSSDFRCDELLHKLLFSLWIEGLQRGFVSKGENNALIERENEVSNVLDLFHELKYDQVLFYVGSEIGKQLRYIHDLGALRGFNNSWPGNSIISLNGEIGFCDFDDSLTPGGYSERELQLIHAIELDGEVEMTYNTIGEFRSIFAKLICATYCEALRDGYVNKRTLSSPQSLKSVLNEDFFKKTAYETFTSEALTVYHGLH